MAHHSDRPDPILNELLKEEARKNKLGATGNYPQGMLTNTDEGELKMGIAHTSEKVIINFGTPVEWIGFDPEQAREIARLLIEHANAIMNHK